MSVIRLITDGLSITQQGMSFETGELNAYLDNYYWDDFSYLQAKYGVYGIMKLNKRFKYTVSQFMGRPLMLQKLDSCVYENGCLVTEMRQELTPDIAYSKCSWCYDENIDSAFEHTLTFTDSGDVELDEHGRKRFELMASEIIRNFGLSVRGNLSVGDFHQQLGGASYDFTSNSSVEERLLFGKTTQTTKGWIQLAKEYSSTFNAPWLDRAEGDVTAFNSTIPSTGEYDGTVAGKAVSDILDELRAKAPKQLQTIINRGPREINGQIIRPLIFLSRWWYNAMISEANRDADKTATNARKFTSETDANGQITYFFRGQYPIIPLDEADLFDEFTTGTTNYIGWGVNQNVQFGGNFSQVDDNGAHGLRPGLIIQRDNSIHSSTYKHWGMLSHVMLKSAIADVNLQTGMISYIKEDPDTPGTYIII